LGRARNFPSEQSPDVDWPRRLQTANSRGTKMINRNPRNLQLMSQISENNPFKKTVVPRIFDIMDDFNRDVEAIGLDRRLSPEGKRDKVQGHLRKALRDRRNAQKPLEEYHAQTASACSCRRTASWALAKMTHLRSASADGRDSRFKRKRWYYLLGRPAQACGPAHVCQAWLQSWEGATESENSWTKLADKRPKGARSLAHIGALFRTLGTIGWGKRFWRRSQKPSRTGVAHVGFRRTHYEDRRRDALARGSALLESPPRATPSFLSSRLRFRSALGVCSAGLLTSLALSSALLGGSSVSRLLEVFLGLLLAVQQSRNGALQFLWHLALNAPNTCRVLDQIRHRAHEMLPTFATSQVQQSRW